MSEVQAQKQIIEATNPRINEPIGPSEPQAGVIATRPATAPVAAPNMVALPESKDSIKSHPKTAAPVAAIVLTNTKPATPSAANSLPTLKPNQPTHKMMLQPL